MELRRLFNLDLPSERRRRAPEAPLRSTLVVGKKGMLSRASRLGPSVLSSPEPSAFDGMDRTPTRTSVTVRSLSVPAVISSTLSRKERSAARVVPANDVAADGDSGFGNWNTLRKLTGGRLPSGLPAGATFSPAWASAASCRVRTKFCIGPSRASLPIDLMPDANGLGWPESCAAILAAASCRTCDKGGCSPRRINLVDLDRSAWGRRRMPFCESREFDRTFLASGSTASSSCGASSRSSR